ARTDEAPARMELLRDAAVAAVREERCQIEAGARVLRDLQQYALAQEEMDVGDDGGPVEALGRHVLAEGAGRDRVALGSEVVDRLEGKQAHRAVGTAVMLEVALRVALEAEPRHLRFGHGALGHPARRDAELDDRALVREG